MAEDGTGSASRRGALKIGALGAGAAVLAAAGAGLARPAPAAASSSAVVQTKIAKTMLQYQDHPNGNNRCSGCAQFEPPDQCKIVEGPISPDGWCAAFAPKGA